MTELMDKEQDVPISGEGDDIRQYLREIRVIPRLSPEEERDLARRCAQGDEDAVRRMVSANLRLVVSVAREYAGRGVPLLDLIQEGSLGLLAAAKKYDYSLDYRFSTYATKWIRQGVTRCLMNHGSPIRVPLHTAERMRKTDAVRKRLLAQLSRDPTPEEISAQAGIPAEKVEELLRLMPEVCSLDTPTGDDEKSTLGMLLEDDQTPQPQEELVRQELEQNLSRLMDTLTPRQQRILRLHFGMEDGRCRSLEEIGSELGISKERVRQIERQAMDKLQRLGTDMGLEDFLT